MVAVRVVSSDAPPASSIASPAATACSRLPLRDPRLDAERVGARQRQRVRAAVGLPGAQPAEQRAVEAEPERAPEARVLDGDRPVLEIGQEDVVVRAGLGARDLAQVDAPAVLEQRVRPGLALRRRQARRVLPGLGQRHDRARRSVQPAAGLEERRADDAVVPPDEVVRARRERFSTRSCSVSVACPRSSSMRRSSANGVRAQRTRQISSTASSPWRADARRPTAPSATSPWNGSSTPR